MDEQIVYFQSLYPEIVAAATAPSPQQKVESWIERFGMVSPREVHGLLSANSYRMQMLLSLEDGCHTSLEYLDDAKAQAPTNFATLMLHSNDPLNKTQDIAISNVNVHGVQGANSGKLMMHNLVNLLQTHYPNVNSIELGAENVGSYAWALFGFEPAFISNDMKKTIAKRLHWIAELQQLPPQLHVFLSALIEQNEPRNLRLLAELKTPVIVPPQYTQKDQTGNACVLHAGDVTTLGKYLLLNLRWKGKLDMTNPEIMTQQKIYLSTLRESHGIRVTDKFPKKGSEMEPGL